MSDPIVINQPGLEQRTSKSGKVRYTIALRTEPLLFDLDEKTIAAQLTAAIVQHLRQSVKNISATAAPATIKARKVAAKAYAAGKPWAVRQFSGGKTGATPPDASSTKAFNFSQRFVNSIVGSASSDGHWRVNVAANRLNPQFGDVTRIWNRLVQLVPEFADSSKLMQNSFIKKRVEDVTKGMVTKLKEQSGKLSLSLLKTAVDVASQFGDLLSA